MLFIYCFYNKIYPINLRNYREFKKKLSTYFIFLNICIKIKYKTLSKIVFCEIELDLNP